MSGSGSTPLHPPPPAQKTAAAAQGGHEAHGHGSNLTLVQAGLDAVQLILSGLAFVSVFTLTFPTEFTPAPALVAFCMVLSVFETDKRKMLFAEMLVGAGFIASWNLYGNTNVGLALLAILIILNSAQILLIPGLTWLATSGGHGDEHGHHP